MHLLAEERPELDDGRARALVHAAIGAIQSVASYDSSLARRVSKWRCWATPRKPA